jgi:A/G-specific adenine glycosylase
MPDTLGRPASDEKSRRIARRLLAWWDVHRRALPWRAAATQRPNPYAVWLSEILLQQTTVTAAIPYFNRFMARWPRVEDLAAASVEEVMQAFAGLGYYSRARNLHLCAREVAERGAFPLETEELRKLPGVGAYTSQAIAAIAFGRRASPVDGNVARIIARLFALPMPIAQSRKTIAGRAASLTPNNRAGDFAQAMMDLGAMICTPRKPDCKACPLGSDCAASASGEPQAFPRRAPRAARPLRMGAAFFVRASDGRVLMRTRPAKGLLGGTVELPGSEWSVDFEMAQSIRHAPFQASWRRIPGSVEQAFTHFHLQLAIYAARMPKRLPTPRGCYWIEESKIPELALSSVMVKAVACALRHEAGGGADTPQKFREAEED